MTLWVRDTRNCYRGGSGLCFGQRQKSESEPGINPMKLKDSKLFRQQCYVNGQWADADGGETIEVTNPVDGSVIGTVPRMGTAETRRAIEAAEVAQKEWRMLTGKERAAILRKWFDLMMAHQEDLAILMTTEQGKPIAESRGEIAYAAAFIEWFAEESHDHPQGRPGTGRGLFDGGQAGDLHTLFGAGHGGTG